GLSADDWGRWFTATNSQHLRHIILPDHYLRRNQALPVSAVTLDIPEHGAACKVFRKSPFEAWRVERTTPPAGRPHARRFPPPPPRPRPPPPPPPPPHRAGPRRLCPQRLQPARLPRRPAARRIPRQRARVRPGQQRHPPRRPVSPRRHLRGPPRPRRLRVPGL